MRPTAILLLALLALAGCGGGDRPAPQPSPSPTPTGPTKRQFLRAADRACADTRPRLKALERRLGRAQRAYAGVRDDARALARAVRVTARATRAYAAVYRRTTERVDGLERPRDAVVEQYLQRRGRLADQLDAQARAELAFARAQGRARDRANQRIVANRDDTSQTLSDLQALAVRAGFNDCTVQA